jgi:hypothetical protein
VSERKAVEYVPTPEDRLELRRFLHRRLLRHPLVMMFVAGVLCLTAGGAMMASAGSALWSGVMLFGVMLSAAMWIAYAKIAPTPASVEKEFSSRAWLDSPFRIEADDAGVVYEHGPFRARLSWQAFGRLVETEHALMLTERPSPGAMVYGLSKRELNRTPGGAGAWRDFITARISAARHAPASP